MSTNDYFSIPDHVAKRLKEVMDQFNLDEYNRRMVLEEEARRILSERGYSDPNRAIGYEDAVEILTDALCKYKPRPRQ